MPPEQLQFFASLDFPGRTTLLLAEMAEKLGVSKRHLQKEVEAGVLTVLDVRGKHASQACWRVPVECYRDYVITRLSGPRRSDFLAVLPPATRRQLIAELQASLKP
jgi:hypothetical protein